MQNENFSSELLLLLSLNKKKERRQRRQADIPIELKIRNNLIYVYDFPISKLFYVVI